MSPRALSPRRLNVWTLAAVGILLFASPKSGAAQKSGAEAQIRTTAITLQRDGLSEPQQTALDIGIRKGIREHRSTRYVYASDALSATRIDTQLGDALEELEALIEPSSRPSWKRVQRRSADVLSQLRKNIRDVRRSELAAAMALNGIADCALKQERSCLEKLGNVYSFRPGFDPSSLSLSPQLNAYFDRALRGRRNTPRSRLKVRTEPPGLEVFIDGQSMSTSPVSEELKDGLHYVTVRGFGFEKSVTEVELERNRRIVVEPMIDERVLIIERERIALLDEMKSHKVGPAISGMSSYLSVARVVLATISNDLELELILVDLRSKTTLASVKGLVTSKNLQQDAAFMAANLFNQAELSAETPYADGRGADDGEEIYETWWFWTGVGAIVVGGTATAIALSSGGSGDVPSGTLRLRPELD